MRVGLQISLEFVDVHGTVNVILIESFSRGGAAPIPEHATGIDAWDEQDQFVELDVVDDMAAGLVASVHIKSAKRLSEAEIGLYAPAQVVEVAALSVAIGCSALII